MTDAIRLLDAWQQCQHHLYHLNHAMTSLASKLPATANNVALLDDETVQDWDQFILRFIKLQDTLGARTYAALLDYLQEPSAAMPMLDKLNRLEQLDFLSSTEDWGLLRVLRNQFSHDYPQDNALRASYLNQSIEAVSLLKDAMFRLEKYLTTSGLL